MVEGTNLDAQAGDVVIVSPDAWHSFVNTGPPCSARPPSTRTTRAASDFEDGTRRE